MTLEERLERAFRSADRFEPSPDLFTKVQRSITEDRLHRRRVTRVLWVVAASVLAVGGYLALTIDVVDGVWTMPFPALEFLVTVLMLMIVVVMGPTIRRFGGQYEQEVFAASRGTGVHVLRLLDIAYYLVFVAFIVMSHQFEPLADVGTTLPEWVRSQQVRVGGLLLVMGLLHGLMIIGLPVVGIVFAANQRRLRIDGGAASSDRWLDGLDRAITVVTWVLLVLLLVQVVGGVLNVLTILGAPG